jgi:hypothetical protein
MAYWDFLGTTGSAGLGADAAIEALGTVQPTNPIQGAVNSAQGNFFSKLIGGIGDKMMNILDDPNTYATMGQMAEYLDSGMSAGGAAGKAGYNNVRRQAMQESGGKLADSQSTMFQQLLDAVIKGDPWDQLTPKGAPGLDSMTFGGDGTFTAKASGIGKKQQIEGPQKPLESVESVNRTNDPF